MNATVTPAAGTEVPDTLAASQPRYSVVRLDGRYKVYDLAEATYTTCASRTKAEERAAKLNAVEAPACPACGESTAVEPHDGNCPMAIHPVPAAAPLEVVTLDGTETTIAVEETAVSPVSGAMVPVETALAESAAIFAETGILTAVEVTETVEQYGPDAVVVTREYEPTPAEDVVAAVLTAAEPAIKEMAAEVRARLLAEKVNAGEMTFAEAAAQLPAAPAAEKAEPMRSLWVAAAFVPIILADAAPERATLVAKLDASVPNNRGGRTVRLTRAEAEELAAIGTEIENAAGGVGRNAHSARTMRARLAALWA